MTDLEKEFHLLMRSIYDRAKKECNYSATRFLQMLQTHGGVETAKRLLNQPQVSEGFIELFKCRRLDLTVEAQLLDNPKYWTLFTEKQIDTARRWIRDYEAKLRENHEHE